ncbi:MAG: glycosyltransferase family 39 protein [Anaerolineales bacterium]|nr:glycosyltransferase family 39 protein [Anaerolineales bacterium]
MNEIRVETLPEAKQRDNNQTHWLYDVALILILIAAAVLRTVGMDWDEGQHLHPDERFLSAVEGALETVPTIGEYFDTAVSPLNPHNRGYGFFVYGTFPIILVRYFGEWIGQTGYGPITIVGRYMSAFFDWLVILLVYLTASKLYDKRVGILAAAFSAFTVLEIQLSHFFAVDTFTNFFIFLCIYIGVLIATDDTQKIVAIPDGVVEDKPVFNPWHFVLFGVAFGLGLASKLSAYPAVILLPAAVAMRMSRWKREKWERYFMDALGWMVVSAFVTLLMFRVFQPYAFSGPGFFGIKPNELWVANIQSQRAQAAGDIDWPPSIQWARLNHLFSGKNLVMWGIGIPMSVFAWGGFLFMGAQMVLKKTWRKHILVWGWTLLYFGWQSMAFNPTMRYQLPVYAPLAVMAGWGVVALWDWARARLKRKKFWQAAAILLGSVSMIGTIIYAVAFSTIYTRPVTRVEAARWIYQNIPGPITLPISTSGETINQQVAVSYDRILSPDNPLYVNFIAKESGTLNEIQFKHILLPENESSLSVRIAESSVPNVYGVDETVGIDLSYTESQDTEVIIRPITPLHLVPDSEYQLNLVIPAGGQNLHVNHVDFYLLKDGEIMVVSTPLQTWDFYAGTTITNVFSVPSEGIVAEIHLYVQTRAFPNSSAVKLTSLIRSDISTEPLTSGEMTVSLPEKGLGGYSMILDKPLAVVEGQTYLLEVQVDNGAVELLGTATTNETTWDDGQPLRVDGYDGYGGIYQPGLVLEMYWDNNEDLRTRYIDLLDQSEYLFITSSRVWASTPRIPERYPLNIAYYRALLGCPDNKSIEWCYNTAQPGDFEGKLGYELVQVFQSNPQIGSFEINDQPSEEAFTVYDHPKVFIFQKTTDYSHDNTVEILNAVDLTNVQHLTPKQATATGLTPEEAANPPDALLNAEEAATQQSGGTWSELYNTDSPINRLEWLGVVVWYMVLMLLGITCYPLFRIIFGNLADRGYALARAGGLLLLAYIVWLGGSAGIPVTRGWIAGVWGFLLVASSLAFWYQREGILEEVKNHWKDFLRIELIFLSVFLLGLLVRLGNPDLWHPYKGGEKPMDFAYFNAVLKSTTFPPYDPWFAGGALNYYYWGFVFIGVLVKLLKIVPSFAYNLILPSLLAMVFLGAFSVSRSIFLVVKKNAVFKEKLSWGIGLMGGSLMALLGNLGSIRMIYWGYARIGASKAAAVFDDGSYFQKLFWAGKGLVASFGGDRMPYGIGDWYWVPSRVIRAPEDVEPITEFPMFTFTYGDPHAHFFALVIALLALGWVTALVLGNGWPGKRNWWQALISLSFGALAVSALQATNTWDYPLYLALGCIGLIYAGFNPGTPEGKDEADNQNVLFKLWSFLKGKGIITIGSVVGFYLLFKLFFLPYTNKFVQGYTSVGIWKGTHTPFGDYLTHWGVFLILYVIWLAWETKEWMATTPLTALDKYRNSLKFIPIIPVLLAAAALLLQLVLEIKAGWVVVPLGIWTAIVLIFHARLEDSKRWVLFMMGSGLFLTLMVETIVLSGDIGRMNTVFKFYLQVWTLYSVSVAALTGWTILTWKKWSYNMRTVIQMVIVISICLSLLFPFMGTIAKVKDRMAPETPVTLDGMDYMGYATYPDQDATYDLSQDQKAIRWVQENIEGSPVFLEGHTSEYRWGSRFSIYTGNPSVIGWNWHQRQQRGFIAGTNVEERINDVRNFYDTDDPEYAVTILNKYTVSYFVVGQLEENYYQAEGLEKFSVGEGIYWTEIYHDEDTSIYQVLR